MSDPAGKAGLPRIDRHAVPVAASPEETWRALGPVLTRSFGGYSRSGFARLLGCRDRGSGRFEAEAGAVLDGFHVTRAEPPRLLELEGRHRFSRYRLSIRVDPSREGAYVSAETHATFPGVHGRAYRALVVGSGGHRIVTRRILKSIARRAERASTRHRKEEA